MQQPSMASHDEPVMGVCGLSGSGKTTLLEAVLPELVRRGLRVAVLKHDVHGIVVDTPGKDSDRLFRAGGTVHLQGPGETFIHHRPQPWQDLEGTVRAMLAEHDLVLVEGHKQTPLPKVWLESADGQGPADGVEGVVTVMSRDEDRPAHLLAILEEWLPSVWRRRRCLGGVLVGGRSRRMGRPKSEVRFRGQTLMERVIGALEPHVERVVQLGAASGGERLPRLADAADSAGPMAGLLAAMRWAPGAAWVLAACDLPLISREAVGWLLDQRAPGRWAVIPQASDRGVEPLLAVYEPQARVLLEQLARRGERAPRLIAELGPVHLPVPPRELEAAWTNVNTPDELAALGED